jgi:hypothetical protein
MEEKRKNQIPTFLMVVGVLFILISGSIFVTNAWKYLPDIAKQLCLLLAAVGLFVASYIIGKGGRLQKTESAFYYLGTAFAGFFILAVSGGLTLQKRADVFWAWMPTHQSNAAKVLGACLLMLVFMGARVYRKKRVLDFIIVVFLTDGILACTEILVKYDIQKMSVLLATYMLLYSVLDYCRVQANAADESMNFAVEIAYLIHAVICITVVFILHLRVTDTAVGLVTLIAVLLVIATSLTYTAGKKDIYRILQSVSILGFGYTLVYDLNALVQWTDRIIPVLFAAVIVNLIFMVWLGRREMYITLFAFVVLMSFIQDLDMLWNVLWDFLWNSHLHLEDHVPFFAAFAVAEGFLWFKDKKILHLKLAGIQLLTGMFMMGMAVKASVLGGIEFSTAEAIGLMLAGSIYWMIAVRNTSVIRKQVFKTVALFHGAIALGALSQSIFDVPTGYVTEWNCAVAGIGIVLLSHIWYDKKEVMQHIQFVVTCLLLVILLVHNMFGGELGNVLILGVACVAIILVAAVYNRREYVIAASVALGLLVLNITRDFWLSIAWWVYLFAAGVVLIVLAVKKEKES